MRLNLLKLLNVMSLNICAESEQYIYFTGSP